MEVDHKYGLWDLCALWKPWLETEQSKEGGKETGLSANDFGGRGEPLLRCNLWVGACVKAVPDTWGIMV